MWPKIRETKSSSNLDNKRAPSNLDIQFKVVKLIHFYYMPSINFLYPCLEMMLKIIVCIKISKDFGLIKSLGIDICS